MGKASDGVTEATEGVWVGGPESLGEHFGSRARTRPMGKASDGVTEAEEGVWVGGP
jgi:hypothetical protein